MTSLRQRMLEDMQVRRPSPFTQRAYVETVARFARYFDRSPDRLGPEQIRVYQVYLASERGLATSSLLVAVSAAALPLSGHASEAMVLRRRDPRAEEAAVVAGRAQPAGSRPVSRCGQAREASHDPDRLLRRRPAHLRGHCPHRVRHRQRTDGPAHREGQGAEGPLRDAVAEAALDSAFLVEGSTAPALALSRRTARGADHAQRSSLPVSMPQGARASARLSCRTCFAILSRSTCSRPAPTCAPFSSCSRIGVCRPPRATCGSRPPRSARPRARWTCSHGLLPDAPRRSERHSVPRPTRTVGEVFCRYGDAFRAQVGTVLSTAQHRVMTAIEQCRTAALGGHVEQCDHCGHRRVWYNSCRNRHCPTCQSLARGAVDGFGGRLLRL